MTSMHNRRGSVLLMAIGMLTILAILASTFLVISNLDSEETESLTVRAYADPIVDGLLAKAIAQISQDRAVKENTTSPYSDMATDATGLVRFMDYPHAYTTNAKAETVDPWLSSSYVPGEGISGPGQLTNLDGPTNAAAYKLDSGIKFAEASAGTYTDDQTTDGVHVCTDGDKLPDAVLYDTKISSPLGGTDANTNTYYVAMRIEDLSSKMCINTAGGWSTTDSSVYDRPLGSGPDMVDLRTFLDKRSGTAASIPIYPLLNAGDTGVVKGRIGDASPASGGTAANPAPASTKGYGRWCGSYLLSPGKPATGTGGYQPFGIGEEVFFLNACSYLDNMSQFGGRINQMISAKSTTTTTPLLDNIRRQLTTMNSVSSVVRWPDTTVTPNFTELLAINTVQTLAECQAVYDRMKLMLDATGIGKTNDDKATMAAHFAANLWAYCSQEGTGEPWKFTTGGITVYGLRQELVITQVFARHISNSKFDANDTGGLKDDSAWGYAIEVSNPTAESRTLSDYEFEIKPANGNTVIVPLQGDGSSLAGTTSTTATTPAKRVVYGCGSGPARPSTTLPDQAKIFGETPVSTVASTWYQNNLMDFRKAPSTSISITLYHKVSGERVPIDFVTIGNNASFDLPYNTNFKPTDISGDYPAKKPPTTTDNPYVYIRRDDRLKTASTGGTRLARFNLAMYKCDGPTENTGNLTGTKLGLANGFTTPPVFDRCTYRTPISGIYSPGIYRPRNVTALAPTVRESMPQDAYFLPSLADLANIYFAGPFRQGDTERPFTVGILQAAKSVLFTDRPDSGRMPTVNIAAPDVANSAQTIGKYPNIPQGFLFHEFFARTPGHQARTKEDGTKTETKRIYGMININTVAIPANVTYNCATWWLPWPKMGSAAPYNRLGLGQTGMNYFIGGADGAVSYIRKYRDQVDRAWVGIPGLRPAPSNIEGFLTPGEVGVPLARYADEKFFSAPTGGAVPDAKLQDADYIRARNCLFGYISDCIATRSDVYACYVTVQHGKIASGRRWRYVAVIDRSNVINPTDKAALIMLTQLR